MTIKFPTCLMSEVEYWVLIFEKKSLPNDHSTQCPVLKSKIELSTRESLTNDSSYWHGGNLESTGEVLTYARTRKTFGFSLL